MNRVGIIGGTGIGDRIAALPGKRFSTFTPYGPFSGKLIERQGKELVLVQRHSGGHKNPPHAVNYRAIAAGLSQLGVKSCFATAAVGSLRAEWGPQTMALATDFLDFTSRNLTMHDRKVRHVDFGEPYSSVLNKILQDIGQTHGLDIHPSAVYVNMNGPRYETPFEIQYLRQLNGDVVGMTAATEAICLREAGIAGACVCIVTNLGCGLSTDVLDHGEVTDVMHAVGDKVVGLLLEAAQRAD